MKKIYTPKAVPVSMSATVSATLKLGDHFFKTEVHEERTISANADVDMDREWAFLMDELNEVCDLQTEELINNFRATKNKA